MSMKREKGTAKLEILQHSTRCLLQNTVACFIGEKTGIWSADILHFGNHRLQTRAVVPLFHDWFVSFRGESLYRLPMISKVHLVGLKWNEMRSHSSKYRIYPFTREGMGVFRDLANTKDV